MSGFEFDGDFYDGFAFYLDEKLQSQAFGQRAGAIEAELNLLRAWGKFRASEGNFVVFMAKIDKIFQS